MGGLGKERRERGAESGAERAVPRARGRERGLIGSRRSSPHWKKSPQRISCNPPNGRCVPSGHTARPIASSASKRWESSMLTSSMSRACARLQRWHAVAFEVTLSTSLEMVPLPRPKPAHEWIVTPCTCDAAMPVGAVTATPPGCRASSCCMMYRNRKDLPVPAAPVRKQFSPPRTRSAAKRCSSFRAVRGMVTEGGAGSGFVGGWALAPPNAAGSLRFTLMDRISGTAPMLDPDAGAGVAQTMRMISSPNFCIFAGPKPGTLRKSPRDCGLAATRASSSLFENTQ